LCSRSVAACGIMCCKDVTVNCKLGRVCVLSIKCAVLSGFVMRCVECREDRVLVFLVGLFAVWNTGGFFCGSGILFVGCDFIWKWWTSACIWSKYVHTCGFQVFLSGMELRVMCLVCRMMVYWFCFVVCVLLVAEGQLKDRIQVIWSLIF